jgi:hypothetical protein
MTDTAPLLQLQQAGLSLAVGAAAGLLYDLFAVQRAARRFLAPLLDLLFCLLTGAALFWLGAGPGGGSLRLFMLLFLLLGMQLYFRLSGGRVRRLLSRLWGLWERVFAFLTAPLRFFLQFMKKSAKKARIFEKKLFQNSKKWFTLYNKLKKRAHSKRNLKKGMGQSDEAEENRYHHEDRDRDLGGLRDRVAYEYPWPDRRGQAGP